MSALQHPHVTHRPVQMRMNFDELVIDNFAGGGGASTGIERAIGRPVDIAINHDPEALAMHAANHPHTLHLCESVWDVKPRELVGNRKVGLVWLSPDCKHHSKAKGGKPVEKNIRGLAWVAVRWAATVKPRIIWLENVEEFKKWGPLITGPDGKQRPCKKREGREFNAFCNALRRQGYVVEFRELRACDYGAPTIRKRLFLCARRDGEPIVWPEATHGDPNSDAVKRGDLLPWRTAAECIDWSIPAASIFERKKPLAEATCRRIARGIMRYVVNNPKPFIVKVNHGYDYFRGQKIDEPLQTVTAKHGYGLAVPYFVPRYGENATQAPRFRLVTKPAPTITPTENGTRLVTAFLAKHYGGNETPGWPLEKPISTVTAQDHHAVIAAHLTKFRKGSIGSAIDAPVHTITAGGDCKRPAGAAHAMGIVQAFLIKYYGADQDPRLEHPLHTITSKDRFGLVTVVGEEYAIVDIGMRMLQPRELYRAQGFPDNYIIGDDPAQGLQLTKSAQVRMCGNSVCPDVAAAIVEANYQTASMREETTL